MLVGEIGIDRREYLYNLTYCDILLITRGYMRRQHYGWEQARLIAYHVNYCMGLPKGQTAKTIVEWLRFPWEDEDEQSDSTVTNEDIERLRQIMREENARQEKGGES